MSDGEAIMQAVRVCAASFRGIFFWGLFYFVV